jgi:hypothetical protein
MRRKLTWTGEKWEAGLVKKKERERGVRAGRAVVGRRVRAIAGS